MDLHMVALFEYIYVQNAIGPKRNHGEYSRRRMEEEISKYASDSKAEKAKDMQDHYITQPIQQEDERE